MPEYMMFIWDDEQAWAHADPGMVDAVMGAHGQFIAEHAGQIRGGNRLHPSAATTCVRADPDGSVRISDGAFAETKEVIGGYYFIEAADLDAALRLAAAVPAPFGGVEVRPIQPTG
jgi:hypothetical protein